jgi:F0F1-type ATP synthase assembly protein I
LKTNTEPKDKSEKFRAIVKYSNIAFQMIGIIVIGTFLGFWLDKYFQLKFPIFTIVLILLSLFEAIYSVVREFLKK